MPALCTSTCGKTTWTSCRRRHDDCPTCGQHQFEYLEGERANTATAYLCGRDAIQVNPGRGHTIKLDTLAARLREVGSVSLNEYLLKLRVGRVRADRIPGRTGDCERYRDAGIARSSLYAKYVGAY